MPELIEAAAKLPCILAEPAPPSCGLNAFGEPHRGAEYWVAGIEDLTDDYRSKVLFCIWNTLKAEDRDGPSARVVHMKAEAPAKAGK